MENGHQNDNKGDPDNNIAANKFYVIEHGYEDVHNDGNENESDFSGKGTGKDENSATEDANSVSDRDDDEDDRPRWGWQCWR